MLATPSFIPLSTLVPTCKDYVKVKKGEYIRYIIDDHIACMYLVRVM